MGKFTVIPQSTFEDMQLDAGVLLKTFNPAQPTAPADENIITATTGGINVVCKPNFSDLGEDVDNIPNNMKELKHLDSWDCSLSTTALGTSPELIKLQLGCADIDGTDSTKIVPRASLEQTDFSDIWWVGDKADGGMVAVQIKNALSTEGFSLKTTKNGKGTSTLTITGHVSIAAQSVVPMVFYSAEAGQGSASVTQTLTNVKSTFTGNSASIGGAVAIALTANDGYTLGTVTVTMKGTNITSTAYSDGFITISDVDGDIVITATATKNA